MQISGLPGPVSSSLGLPSLPKIKLLAAGLALCAHAHVNCAHIGKDEFLSMAARLGMSGSSEVLETGARARRDVAGMCDVSWATGVSVSGHHIAEIPTAVYLYPWDFGRSPPTRIKWGTGFVCVRK